MGRTIAAERHVLVSRTTARTIVPASRTGRIMPAERHVLASRTTHRIIDRDSRTITTGTFLVRALLITAAPTTMLLVVGPMTMLLGPALLITGRPLRKRAMLLGTTVVRGSSRFHVRRRAIGLIRFLSSSRGNTRARGPGIIVRKNNHRRHRTIVRRKLLRQSLNSQPVRQKCVRKMRRRIGPKLRGVRKTSRAIIRLRRRVQHSRLRNVTLVLRHRRNVRAVLLLHPNVSHGPRRLRNSEKIARRRNRNARTIRRRLLRTKTKSPQRAVENWM
jgi:hypothetical protein